MPNRLLTHKEFAEGMQELWNKHFGHLSHDEQALMWDMAQTEFGRFPVDEKERAILVEKAGKARQIRESQQS